MLCFKSIINMKSKNICKNKLIFLTIIFIIIQDLILFISCEQQFTPEIIPIPYKVNR